MKVLNFESGHLKKHRIYLADPFCLSRSDKLVNDTLGCIAKVPKLGLPKHQSVGVGHGVAQFKPEDAVLRQGGVADGVGGLVGIQVGQGVVHGHVFSLMMENMMPLKRKKNISLHRKTEK